MMAATEKPKRVIDRERQWRKVDAGHYTSPKGRFHATREDDGWMLLDGDGEFEPEWFARWRGARRRVEAVEFGDGVETALELIEDEIDDEFHNVYHVKAIRRLTATEWTNVFEIIVRRGEIVLDAHETYTPEEADALATALRLATHRAAAMTRKEA